MENIGFFIPISYGNLPKSFDKSVMEIADHYFYLGGKKACVIAGRVENGKEGVTLAEGNSSWFLSALKVASYFTIILPLLALVVKALLRYKNQFYMIDARLIHLPNSVPSQTQAVVSEANLDLARRDVRVIDPKAELEKGIQIEPNLIARIQQLMPKIQRREENPQIEWLSQCHTEIFRLRDTPNLVFKMFTAPNTSLLINGKFMNGEEQIRNRFNNMVKAKEVCLTHRLGCITIPQAKLFEIEAGGRTFPVIAEQSLDVRAIDSVQEELYRVHADELGQAVRQLGTFIAETGFNDVIWRNIPIVDEAPDFQGERRIGLIDFEHMERPKSGILGSSNGSYGLVRCLFSEAQIDGVLSDAKQKGIVSQQEAEQIKARRLEEIRSDRQLLDFYQRKGILADHRKQIEVDLNTLGLNLDERGEISERRMIRNGTDDGLVWKRCSRAVTMREVAAVIVDEVNHLIQEAVENESVKGKRYILLDSNSERLNPYFMLGIPNKHFIEQGEEKLFWFRRIIDALVEKGHLFKFVKHNGCGYCIQA